MGLGVGPLFLGPLSEFVGRNPVYWAAYGLFWTFTWPVAFATNAGKYLESTAQRSTFMTLPSYRRLFGLSFSDWNVRLRFPQRGWWECE